MLSCSFKSSHPFPKKEKGGENKQIKTNVTHMRN